MRAIFFLTFLMVFVLFVPYQTHADRVTDHDNRVSQDSQVNPHDTMGADDSDAMAGTVRKDFEHPSGWFFDEFKDGEKDSTRPEKLVDVLFGNNWTKHGAVVESSNSIIIVAHSTNWGTADAFPVKADGNLKGGNGGNGGGEGSPPERHWAAIVDSSIGVMDVTEKDCSINMVRVVPDAWLYIGKLWVPDSEDPLSEVVTIEAGGAPAYNVRWKSNHIARTDIDGGALGDPIDVTINHENAASGTVSFSYGKDSNSNNTLDAGEVAGTASVFMTHVAFLERIALCGYDDRITPHAILVPSASSNSAARLYSDSGVHSDQLRLKGGEFYCDVSEDPESGSVRNLTLSGKGQEADTQLEAYFGKCSDPVDTLDVLVRDKKEPKVKYIKTSVSPNGTHAPQHFQSEENLNLYVNSAMWGKQANIYADFDLAEAQSTYDKNSDGKLAVPQQLPGGGIKPETLVEYKQLREDLSSDDHNHTLFHVKAFDDANTLGFMLFGDGAVRDNGGAVLHTIAHELGHAYGAEHAGRQSGDLMYALYQNTGSATAKIGKVDWDEVQPLNE